MCYADDPGGAAGWVDFYKGGWVMEWEKAKQELERLRNINAMGIAGDVPKVAAAALAYVSTL